MKTPLTTLYLIFTLSIFVHAQEIRIVDEKSEEINKFAYCIRTVKEFVDCSNGCIGVKVIDCGNLIGSFPGEEGKDILLYDIYISIKQLDETSGKTLTGYFWVKGKFHNPRNYEFAPLESRLTFEHGTEKDPIKISLILSGSGIKIE